MSKSRLGDLIPILNDRKNCFRRLKFLIFAQLFWSKVQYKKFTANLIFHKIGRI